MAEALRVLVVDDEPPMRHMLRLVLEKAGYAVGEADGAAAALAVLRQQRYPLVLCDIRMPGQDGVQLLEQIQEQQPGVTVIMMSAYGSLDSAMDCMKRGAYDYIAKPFKPDEVVLTLRKAVERLGLQRENRNLRQQLQALQPETTNVIGVSPALQQALSIVARAARSPLPVLIVGETGTGKEVIARELHRRSDHADGPFIPVNCGAISAHLVESELFGHLKGSFTGADRNRDGLFVAANGGTLFLDEIGELPLALQPSLLRVLQEGEVRRVGDNHARRINVRILAATARDLRQEIQAGRFREDLYYRLNAVDIHLPPLRERIEDIPPLMIHFAQLYARKVGRKVPQFAPEVTRRLQARSWPGNARELQNYVEKILLFHQGDRVGLDDLPDVQGGAAPLADDSLSLKTAIAQLEVDSIRRALQVTGGNRTRAAELLEISLRALHYKLKEYDLDG